eukprot:6198068-Pleurochrysis_carterae.AAC.2
MATMATDGRNLRQALIVKRALDSTCTSAFIGPKQPKADAAPLESDGSTQCTQCDGCTQNTQCAEHSSPKRQHM